MGAYIPGMEEHNAVNNDDGFTTGFIGNKSHSTRPVAPQSFLTNTQQIPIQNTQQMPMMNNQQMPMQNTQATPVQNTQQMTMMNNQTPMMNTQQMPMMNNQTPMMNTQQMPMMNNQQAPMMNNTMPKKMPKPPKSIKNNSIQQMTGAMTTEEKTSIASKVIYAISILIMVSLIVFIALYLSGKINLNKKVEEPQGDPEPVVDLEKEKIEKILVKLNSACNNLDDDGNYGQPTVQGEEECSDLTCFINENVMCQGKLCMIAVEDKVYTRDCSTGSNKVANKDAFQASVNLGDLCNTVMNNPDLNGSIQASYGTCVYFECVTEVGGELFERSCRENS